MALKIKSLAPLIFVSLLSASAALGQVAPQPAAPSTGVPQNPPANSDANTLPNPSAMPLAGTSITQQTVPPIRPVKLVRLILIALDQANKTGNYSVLQDLGAPAFQANSAARLAEVFAPLRRQGIDLSMAAVLDPQFAAAPRQGPQGLLRLVGALPPADGQVAIGFDLRFAPVNGHWRIYDINVGPTQFVATTPGTDAPKPSKSSKRAQNRPSSR